MSTRPEGESNVSTYRASVLDELRAILKDEHEVMTDLRQLERNVADTASNIDDDAVLREVHPVVRCTASLSAVFPRASLLLLTEECARDLHLRTADHGSTVALECEKVLRTVEVLEAGTLKADRALEAGLGGLLGV